MKKRWLFWGIGIILGLILIYVSYILLGTASVLKSYQTTFQQLEHPQGTKLIDAFKYQFSYYPATYPDESIQNQCAYLVGEVRSYSGTWNELQAFYQGKAVIHDSTDKISVRVIPVTLVSESGASPSLDAVSTFSYTPFDLDVLAELESHYYFWGYPRGINESDKSLYVVFIAPACE